MPTSYARATASPRDDHSAELRVFISSTFLDMQPEREYLLKQVFPELRQICRERGVTFTEIDLRWGITELQARKRKIVSTCLDEIHRHTPYVIGIIGDRYGWQPGRDDIGDPSVLERYPWLASAVDARCSLVELECVESTLHNQRLRDRTSFYFRRSAQSGSKPESDEEARVLALKERIRMAGLPVREAYGDVETLGEWVREDLLRQIDLRFPSVRNLSFLERERQGHEAFATSRRRMYVPNQEMLRRLDEHAGEERMKAEGGRMKAEGALMSTPGQERMKEEEQSGTSSSSFILHPSYFPLVITGDSGSGKSSLLSYWSDRFRREHPGAFVIMHHVGATPTSTSHLGLLRRVMLEIKERYNVAEEVPTAPERIESDFRYWLGYVKDEGGRMKDEEENPESSFILPPSSFILCIDALNQLEPASLRSLRWLPESFPPNVLVIVSTLDGEILEELERRKWEVLRVEPLSRQEREKVVKRYFHSFGKELDARNVRRLVSDAKSISPLYLVTTMEELRLFGTFEQIGQRIGHYLEADDLDDLFQRVLMRLEDDYGTKLVREVMSLIWASREGMSRSELQEVTGCAPLGLSRLLHALEYHLLQRDGLLGFFHEHLQRAVQQRYLSNRGKQQRARLALVRYFETQPPGARSSRELVWQLHEAGDRNRLVETLAAIPHFIALYRDETQYEVLGYWSELVEHYDPECLCLSSLEQWRLQPHDDEETSEVLLRVAELLESLVRWDRAKELHTTRLALAIERGDRAEEAGALTKLGGLNELRGEHAAAYRELTLARDLYQELGDLQGASSTIVRLAIVHFKRGEHEEALRYYHQVEAICHELGDRGQLAAATCNIGNVYESRGEYEEALGFYRQAEAIYRELGNRRGLASVISNRGMVYRSRGEHDEALECFRQAESIYRELGDRYRQARVLINAGNVPFDRGDYDAALELFRRGEALMRELGSRNESATALGNIAMVHYRRGEYDEALGHLYQMERISRELGDRTALSIAIGNMGTVFADRAEYARALDSLDAAAREHRAIGFRYGLTYWLEGIARVLLELVATGGEMPEYLPAYVPDAAPGRSPADPEHAESWRPATLRTARKHAKECITISRELSKLDTRFSASVLLARLDAAEGRREIALERLVAMLGEASEEQRAELHYWLWKTSPLITSPPGPLSVSTSPPGPLSADGEGEEERTGLSPQTLDPSRAPLSVHGKEKEITGLSPRTLDPSRAPLSIHGKEEERTGLSPRTLDPSPAPCSVHGEEKERTGFRPRTLDPSPAPCSVHGEEKERTGFSPRTLDPSPAPLSVHGEGPGERSRAEALLLYERLAARSSGYVYRQRLEELRRAIERGVPEQVDA